MLHVKDLADQRETIGVDAAGGQRKDHVARSHAAVVNDLRLIHDAHGETGQIIVAGGHHAGMLRRLAADEGAAGLHAALCHAGDDGRHLLRLVFADGDVVQKEQGLRAAADNIVDAHGHAVNADGIMLVQQLGNADLGADAVGAGHQNRHTGKIRRKQAAKAANIGHNARDHGALDVLFHQLDALVARFNIDSGLPVAVRKTTHITLSFH